MAPLGARVRARLLDPALPPAVGVADRGNGSGGGLHRLRGQCGGGGAHGGTAPRRLHPPPLLTRLHGGPAAGNAVRVAARRRPGHGVGRGVARRLLHHGVLHVLGAAHAVHGVRGVGHSRRHAGVRWRLPVAALSGGRVRGGAAAAAVAVCASVPGVLGELHGPAHPGVGHPGVHGGAGAEGRGRDAGLEAEGVPVGMRHPPSGPLRRIPLHGPAGGRATRLRAVRALRRSMLGRRLLCIARGGRISARAPPASAGVARRHTVAHHLLRGRASHLRAAARGGASHRRAESACQRGSHAPAGAPTHGTLPHSTCERKKCATARPERSEGRRGGSRWRALCEEPPVEPCFERGRMRARPAHPHPLRRTSPTRCGGIRAR